MVMIISHLGSNNTMFKLLKHCFPISNNIHTRKTIALSYIYIPNNNHTNPAININIKVSRDQFNKNIVMTQTGES